MLAARLAAAFTLCLGLAALAPAQAQTPLRSAVDPNFPPHASVRLSGGLEGFQIDLAAEIGRVLKRPVSVDSGNFAGLIPAMNAGRYDFLVAPVTASAERAESMLFTEGYLFTALQFGLRRGSEPLKSAEDLRGKVLAVNKGSNYDGWAQANAAKYGFTALVLDNFTDATMAVMQGRAYAQLGGNTTIKFAASRNRQFVADLVLRETRSHWAIPVAKGNVELRNQLDAAIECLKQDGTLVKLSEKWFGEAPAEDDAERVVFPGYGVPGLPGYDPTPHAMNCR
ncbi:transporter substrate-binding domain-containing protein [Acetobacteraceae bacterium H6797]|nr:transporter substrate-binding domain-containing protein [Acetobacteraceae bacterium H6797]